MSIIQFLRETRTEMKNVVWPSRKRTVIYALVVIVLSLAIGYFLGAFDTLFQAGLRNVISF